MGTATVCLIAIALFHSASIGGIVLFLPLLLIGWAFLDAAFCVGLPVLVGMFPMMVRASGVGVAYGIRWIWQDHRASRPRPDLQGRHGSPALAGHWQGDQPRSGSSQASRCLPCPTCGLRSRTKGRSLQEIDDILEQQVGRRARLARRIGFREVGVTARVAVQRELRAFTGPR
ncbi:hypothetical protein HBB16_13660 [Pseudonocardia sp. MCCB 268]|nr:hypothetical protein [Pseudonocardia cytotoxica]